LDVKQDPKSARDGPCVALRGGQKFLACINTLFMLKRCGQLDASLQTCGALY